MRESNVTSGTPQFGTAEYSGQGGQCRSCKQPVQGSFYRVNGLTACPRCLEELKRRLPQDTHEAFVRALFFGASAAVLGLVLYAAFGIITGLMIGYVSLAVGYLVGKTIKLGSGGIGGRRYQVAAAALTYAAVSLAAVPISLAQIAKHRPAHYQQSQSDRAPSGEVSPADGGDVTPAGGSQGQDQPRPGMGAALGSLALLGLASPLLELQDPVRGLIGLVILFVGIRIAWRITAGVQLKILGPFSAAAPGADQPSAAG
jgi:hypothetical protein